MKFIVTGGAGFIGHNVVRNLEALGHECFLLDSITDYGFINNEELSYLKTARLSRIRANVHYIDLRKHDMVKNFFLNFSYNCDAVIHLASFPRQKAVSSNPLWAADVMGTSLVQLLELTRLFKIPKFVYISSSMVYGDFTDGVKEDAVCNPQGQYGIMKLMGEDLVQDYTRRGCFNHTIIRPSAVYGEYDVEDRVGSKFIINALRGHTLNVNGAEERLDFTHVEDTAMGIAQAAVSENTLNKTYNITRSNGRSLREAAELAVKLAGGGSVEIRDRDMDFPTRGKLDISAAQQDFGFNPQIDIETGFARYIEWFKNSSYWQDKL
jgi:nucleoside-diphosphate-sugar epimerase